MTDVPVLNALIFACLGIGLFVATVGALAKVAPFDVWRQVVEERNVAVAIVCAASALGVAWIIAATMH
jgi:putative membrane protein